MKIRFLGRNIEIANRVNVDGFKKEETLIGASWRKQDFKDWKVKKQFLLYCFMPYKWLNQKFCEGKM